MILADENIHGFIIKTLREAGFEVTAVAQTLVHLLKTQTLERPFFATITTKKIRIRQL